jgi:hypothetical protein
MHYSEIALKAPINHKTHRDLSRFEIIISTTRFIFVEI